MDETDSQGVAGWSRYWGAGHDHSCPTSFSGFYGPGLQAFWRRQAAGLSRDDVVLDLGCGNGGLLRFLWSCFPQGAAPAMHGVDSAQLRPSWLSGTAADRIRIHSGASFESLPLPAAGVSFAASIFGFEYGGTEGAWAELLRVLRPRARVAFVLHKRGSRLDAVAADEQAIARAALAADEGALACACRLAPYLERASSEESRAALRADPEAEAARLRFNAATDALVGLSRLIKHGDYAHDILGAVTRVLAGTGSGTGAVSRQRLDDLRRSVEDHLARIDALRASALDREALEGMRSRLRAAGFDLADPATIEEQGHEMGWILEGARERAG